MTAHRTWILTDDQKLVRRIRPLLAMAGIDLRLVVLSEGTLAALVEGYVQGRWSPANARSHALLTAISRAHESEHPARVLVLTDHPVGLRALLRELQLHAEVLGRPEDSSEILDRLLPPGRSSHLTDRESPDHE